MESARLSCIFACTPKNRKDAGEIERAIDSLEKALEISPEYAPAYISKAKALAAIGRRDLALADLGKALRYAANDAQRDEALRLLVQINGGIREKR